MNQDSLDNALEEISARYRKEVLSSDPITQGYTTSDLKKANILATGFSAKGQGDYRLEMRVREARGKAYNLAKQYKSKLKDDARIIVYERGMSVAFESNDAQGRKPSDDSNLGPVVTTLKKLTRPLYIGLEIGHQEGASGTLGAFVVNKDGSPCILSNCHILALSGRAKMRDYIYQPGCRTSRAVRPRHRIGRLIDYVEFSRSRMNEVDCAIAEIIEGDDEDIIPHLGNIIPRGLECEFEGLKFGETCDYRQLTRDALVEMQVGKIGAGTGYTSGKINGRFSDVTVTISSEERILFSDMIEILSPKTTPFTRSGDSGSVLFSRDDSLAPIALHLAGTSGRDDETGEQFTHSYACHLPTVLEDLEVTLM